MQNERRWAGAKSGARSLVLSATPTTGAKMWVAGLAWPLGRMLNQLQRVEQLAS